MYGDIIDAYIDLVIKSDDLSEAEQQEKRADAEEWKVEFKELLKDI